MNRRSFLHLSAAVILTPGLLMPVRKIWTPRLLSGRIGRIDGMLIYGGGGAGGGFVAGRGGGKTEYMRTFILHSLPT